MKVLLTSANIADYLGVSRAAVTQWRQRGVSGMPKPFAETLDGIPLWDNFEEWDTWWNDRKNAQRETAKRSAELKKKKALAELERAEAALRRLDTE